MAKILNSEVQKGDQNEFDNKNTDFFMRYRFKTHYLSIGASEGSLELMREMKGKNAINMQHHYEERKRKAEFRRRKIIQRLKNVYGINVDELNENVTNEIIRKVEIIEKEKKGREKRNVEKKLNMINKLLQEQNRKRKVMAFHTPSWRRRTKNVHSSEIVCESLSKKEILSEDKFEEGEDKEEENLDENVEANELSKKIEMEETKKTVRTESSKRLSTGQGKKGFQETSCLAFQKEKEKEKEEEEEGEGGDEMGEQSDIETNLGYFKMARLCTKSPKAAPVETCLECTPRCVVFEDYAMGRVYLQNIKITNIGLETIHCRYLGIAVKDKSEKRFPIGVAVRDNIKLRPGLSCSTKIRLCCPDSTKELECSIVYETRRQNKPLQHSCFFVPVLCYPARAIVKVTPLKFMFPSLTWCSANGPQGMKSLRKTLKIENTGGKGCSCRISDESLQSCEEEDLEEINGEEEEEEEEEIEKQISKTNFSKAQIETKIKSNNQSEPGSNSEEFFGEESFRLFEQAFCTAEVLVNELIDNVFANFRFFEKYHIEIPPHSVKHIEVRFIPEYKGFHHEIKYLQFEGCHNLVEESIELMGDIKKLPLSSQPQVIDLKTCVANSGVYSGIFNVFNSSKGPYPVKVKIPSCMRKHAHVRPRASIIQSNSWCDFSVRFYPRITLATDAPQYFNQESGIIEFPVFIHSTAVGSCKSDYILIHVFALITDYSLELSPPEINFGLVTTLETVRTPFQLTNHSLTIQEYGFLNLPKGVRVEPNMGFGRILPKETIPLDLLYSPVDDLIKSKTREENHAFQVVVTSLAEYGGFREKLTLIEEDKLKPFESILGECDYYEFGGSEEKTEGDENNEIKFEGEGIESEPCSGEEEDSSIEGEEYTMRISNEEMKIRKYLKEDSDKTSEHSFFKRVNTQKRQSQEAGLEDKEIASRKPPEGITPIEECDEEEEELLIYFTPLRPDYNTIKCEAFVIDPYCQISESVIQLPATPCSSFSLYRFRLNGANARFGDASICGLKDSKKISTCPGKSKFEASFEFQIPWSQIKLEPQSGFLKAGESLPITIIYRPEFPAEQLKHESKVQKTKKLIEERKLERENSSSKLSSAPKSKQKGKQNSSSMISKRMADGNDADEIIKTIELDKYDLFAGEKSLQQLVEPFSVKTRIQCVIKTLQCVGNIQRTEIHEMILICPAVKPSFVYLGDSQEINFGKVFIGTRPKIHLEIQNISLRRIIPGISLLSPVGPFSCPAGLKRVEVDPEHVWRQPLTFSPLTVKGIEREYFEIHCGTTNLFLTVFGEGIEPQYKITPNFACGLVETKIGNAEEVKLEIENLNAKPFKIQVVRDFIKEGVEVQKGEGSGESADESSKKDTKKEKTSGKEDSKDKKKVKNSESDKKNLRTWDDIPDFILSEVENFKFVKDEEGPDSDVFTLSGGGEGNNQITIQPNSKFLIRIRFFPQPTTQVEAGFDKVYAAKYKIILERISLLKEILLIGKISKAK